MLKNVEVRALGLGSSSEPFFRLERILNESDDSHLILVTANGGRGISTEVLQRLKIVEF